MIQDLLNRGVDGDPALTGFGLCLVAQLVGAVFSPGDSPAHINGASPDIARKQSADLAETHAGIEGQTESVIVMAALCLGEEGVKFILGQKAVDCVPGMLLDPLQRFYQCAGIVINPTLLNGCFEDMG